MVQESLFNRNSMVLFISIFLVGIGFSIIIPVLPYYAESMGASGFQLGLLLTVYALCQFIFSPFWGIYSDKVGRKPVLLLGVFGFALTFLLMAFASHLWMLFAARILGGMFSCATMPTAMAYMGDTTTKEKRGASMGMVGAFMGMGMIFGPVLGGLLSEISLATPFLLAGILSAANGITLVFLVKESLSPEKRNKDVKLERAPLWEGLKTPLAVLFVFMFLASLGESTHHGIFALFVEGKLGMTAKDIGWAFMTAGIVSALTQGVLVSRVMSRLGEEKTAQIGITALAVSFVLFSFSFNLASIMIFMAIFACGIGLVRPSINAAVSRRTTDNQGKAMGVLQGYDSLGRVIGPALGGFVLDINLSFAYLTAIAASLLGLTILAVIKPEQTLIVEQSE